MRWYAPLLLKLVLLGLVSDPASAQSQLWDNGPFNDRSALTNGTEEAIGARRTLLFDFVVPSGETWRVTGLNWLALWNTLPPGSGTGMEIRFYSDAGDQPGAPITPIMTSTHYAESATGNIHFSRPEYKAVSTIPAVVLTAGRYWTDAAVVGPENNFWETAEIIDNECWVDYADFGGLQPGSHVNGVSYDINGLLTGTRSGGGYTLSIDGTCPGAVMANWSGAGEGQQALVIGDQEGSTTIPSGPCAGTVLGIEGRVRLVSPPGLFNTRGGNGSITGNANSSACGRFLQLVKAGTCNTSNVVQVPQ
jgi:hypothetical protein